MWFGLISLFPEMFANLRYGVTGRAINDGKLELEHWNPRDYTSNVHHTVDDRPYGGGPGMVMMAPPLQAAIDAAKEKAGQNTQIVLLSPQGKRLDQPAVEQLAQRERMILICGRYEGIDERIIEHNVDEQWSIGDYVLSGGELPAMVMIDSIARLLPGVLGNEESAQQDSFSNGILDHPHYTRPEEFRGMKVPPVLLSGNHAAIRQWRQTQALARTRKQRPDLLTASNTDLDFEE